ncbi:MAG TPA: Rieske (2Fe-2S) protein [Trueperaceae bacterium]|nr:Rieske (2Fe-2S) protein [Trueperaceae bacterium]
MSDLSDPNVPGTRLTSRHVVATVDEIPIGGRKIVTVGNRSIGVFNIGGRYFALRNTCPHQQAPLCEGRVMGTTLPSRPGEYHLGLQGQILRCPWHAWEFDLTTGRSLFDPTKCRVKTFDVAVETVQVETFRTEVVGQVVVIYA